MNDEMINLTPLKTTETWPVGGVCGLDDDSHCITCSDEALPAKVLEVDETLALAQVEINGQRTEIDVSLVDGVEVGQTLLVHGGVALERVEGGQP
jgi:hydrogenase maturation factor